MQTKRTTMRISIPLELDEVETLLKIARLERRTPGDQAALWVARGLKEAANPEAAREREPVEA